MKKVFIVIFVSVVLVFSRQFLAGDCFAAGKDGVLFYAGFNAGINAGKAKGNPEGELVNTSEPNFGPGKCGQALVSGDTEGYVNYEVENNILPEKGTVEFWVCPVDWRGKENEFHIFFEAGDPGWLVIYKYNTPNSGLFLVGENKTTGWNTVGQDFSKFKPGAWCHIAVTWDKDAIYFYIDGKPSSRVENPSIPKGFSGRFMVGDNGAWVAGRDKRSLIDEIYIYDRPLNSNEIKWAFEHALDRKPGEDVPAELAESVFFDVQPFPDKNEIQVDVKLGGRVSAQDFKGSVWLEPADGTVKAQIEKTGEATGRAIIKYKELERKEYKLTAKLEDMQGNEIASREFVLNSPGPAVWFNNKIGISDTPPFPFTAIKFDGKNLISCWNRAYSLGVMGLPSNIKSAGKDMLVSPIELKAGMKGNPVLWKEQPVSRLEENKARVRIKGSAVSEIGTLNWVCTAEYDGMLRYDIVLQPSPGASADKMELRFSIKPEHAALFHLIPYYTPTRTGGALSSRKGVVIKSSWMGYWWLGDEERGLAGFCESNEAWDKVDKKKGFYIERTDNSIDVVWSFIDSEYKFDKPWKFSFGIEATPVKDIKGWHKFRLEPGYNANVSILWPDPSIIRFYGYPEPVKPEEFKKIINKKHNKNIMVVPYSLLTMISSGSPEWQFYGNKWGDRRVDASSADVVTWKGILQGISPAPDCIDFVVWANNKYVRENDLDGLYHDITIVSASMNQKSGLGYVRDGELRPTYPFFATRELYKRVYTMLKEYGKEKGKDMFMIGHMSSEMPIPVLGFCDAYLDGENFAHRVKEDYTGLFGLDYLRSEYMGHNYGVMPYFIPAMPGVSRKVTKELTGLMLIHDFDIWPIWCVKGEIDKAYRVLDEFGFVDAEFTGYWKNSGLVSVTEESEGAVKCSFYSKPKAGALICVANLVNEPCTATLIVEWDKLRSQSPLSVIDAVSKEEMKTEGKSLAVGIEPLGFKIIWVK